MSARIPMVLLGASLAAVGACASMAGHDGRFAGDPLSAAADVEIEPLPPSPKRHMRDPRGVAVFDAGAQRTIEVPDATVATIAAVAAVVPESKPAPATCGSKTDPCPMQRFMHGAMETAHTPGTLTSAFTRVAGMSPDPSWSWVAIATRGADLANAGDVPAAKAQCKACHDAYREPYRTTHRARKL